MRACYEDSDRIANEDYRVACPGPYLEFAMSPDLDCRTSFAHDISNTDSWSLSVQPLIRTANSDTRSLVRHSLDERMLAPPQRGQ